MDERLQRVRETRFGSWVLGTEVWLHHVLAGAIAELESLLGAPRSFGSILDVGCGHGQAFRLLEERFHPHRVLGIDVDPSLVERAAQAARACSCRVETRVGDITSLQLPDASVDMVFCHQTLHHVSEQEQALRELYRVLRPRGVLLLAESCRRFIRSAAVRLFFRHPMEVQRSADEHLELLRAAGFEFDAESVSTPYPWWSRPDFGITEWLGLPVPPNPEPTLVHVAAIRRALP